MKTQTAEGEGRDSLFSRIQWLMFFRAMLVTLLLGATVIFQMREIPFFRYVSPYPFYVLIGFTYALTLLYALLLQRVQKLKIFVSLRANPGRRLLYHPADLHYRGDQEFKDYPVFAVFAEANRSSEVTEALWTVAMGIPTYFWPALPVTGSPKVMELFSQFCQKTFGAKFFVPTDKKTEARPKANFILKEMIGETVPRLSGYPWKEKTN